MRTLGMLKKEPKLLYYYQYIKQDEDRVVKDGWKNKKDELVDCYRIGETFSSEEADKNPEFYKFVCTIRQAFVGDMQEKLNEIYGTDLLRYYAETKENNRRVIPILSSTKIIYVEKPSLFKRIREYLINGKVDSMWLEKELEKNKTILEPSELMSLEDYLNNNKEL